MHDLPQGYEDFREILEKELMLVDKSLLIKEVLDDKKTKVVVITRPRRFGKTLNSKMSLHYWKKQLKKIYNKFMHKDMQLKSNNEEEKILY